MRPRRACEVHRETGHMPRHRDATHGVLVRQQRGAVQDRADLGVGVHRGLHHDVLLLGELRILDEGVHQEAVLLRLGQRVGALLINRVLRGQHEERLRELPRLAAGGNLALLHGLEQRRLRLGRRAVDFVGQDDVAEDRAAHEDDLAPAGLVVLLDHVRADDVRGHQVGRELDALEVELQHAGERADHERLGQAGHALEQAMAAGEDGGEELLEDLALAHDHLAQLAEHFIVATVEVLDLLFDGVAHGLGAGE